MNRLVLTFLAGMLFTVRLAMAGAAPTATVFDGRALCIREPHLTDNFASQFHQLQPTNRVSGTILDLRFADGDSDAVAGAVKSLSAQKLPLVILINSQTRGGAVELALRLREAGMGVVIGGTNATGPITPDIPVAVGAEDERQFLMNPFAAPGTNGVPANGEFASFVDHLTEADLVRKRIKDGEESVEDEETPRPGPTEPVIRDPVLARAVDLVKALAVLKPSRD